jgi:hypothetical protein
MEGTLDDVDVVVELVPIGGNPVDEASVKLVLIGGNPVDDVDVDEALIGRNFSLVPSC